MSFSQGYAGRQAAQPNNSYINIDSYPNSGYQRVLLYCCSNSTSSNIGSFTEPSGNAYYYNFNNLRIQRYSRGSTYGGCIRMEGYRDPWGYLSYNQGMYTCNIPDNYGWTQRVNFALYAETSKLCIILLSWLLHYYTVFCFLSPQCPNHLQLPTYTELQFHSLIYFPDQDSSSHRNYTAKKWIKPYY